MYALSEGNSNMLVPIYYAENIIKNFYISQTYEKKIRF